MTRVLYLTGWCRSGSTVLGNVLGELPGVVHVGELHYLWRNGVLGAGTNTQCGCGENVAQCPLWSKVIARVTGGDPVAFARAAVADLKAGMRTRHTLDRLQGKVSAAASRAVGRLSEVYQAITEIAGARLIIDGSKYPAEAASLLHLPELDVRVLHLVRDPRATAHSWRRAKGYIPAMGVVRSTAYWTYFNAVSDHIGRSAPQRYLRLRYEDFTASPQLALRSVLELCGLTDKPPVDDQGRATLGQNHTVTGNPDRLTKGQIFLVPDNAWKKALPPVPRLAATLLAAPLLRRYRYPAVMR
jgi:hypothetical protein